MAETPTAPHAELTQELRWAESLLDRGDDGLLEYRQRVAGILKRRFGWSLASLWRLAGPVGAREFSCVVALSDDPSHTPVGSCLHERDLPEYIATLARDGLFRSPDAQGDARLAGIRESYLVPQRVVSLLDAAVAVNGVTFGVLCLEQRDTPRSWTTADEVDLRRAVATISLALTRRLALAG